jgi:hypothetical protein
MLRDALTTLPGIGTWDCDEINYIWRHGNARKPHDEFARTDASNSVRRFIRSRFDAIGAQLGGVRVVEKTCANSLRVGFVDEVVHDAQFVFITRDGRDVTASAMRRWTASMEFRYLAKKARYVPLRDLPYYATRFAVNRIKQFRSTSRQLPSWGPRFREIDSWVQNHSLVEVCAKQWASCVERAETELAELPTSRVYRVKYEAFVDKPTEELSKLTQFLKIAATAEQITNATAKVSADSVGKWAKAISPSDLERIAPILEPTLSKISHD